MTGQVAARRPISPSFGLLAPRQLVGAAFAVLFVLTAVFHRPANAYVASLLWALVLMASFVGWGCFLRSRYLIGPASLGLQAVWGMAFSVAVGGVLCFFGISTRAMLLVLVAAGLVALQRDAWATGRWSATGALRCVASLKRSVLIWAAIAVTLGMAAWDAMGWTAFDDPSPRDDMPAYFAFSREIVDRGTLVQPFSFRRLCELGGQDFLHALHLAVGAPSKQLHMMDGGVCVVMLALLIVGQLTDVPRAARALVLGALSIAITLPFTRVNVASEVSTALMVLGLYCTWESRAFRDSPGVRKQWIVALLVAALWTLRNSNLVACVVLVACKYGAPLLRTGSGPAARSRSLAVRELVFVATATGLCLLAWFFLAYRSSGSFLFPILNGYYRKDFGLLSLEPFSIGAAFRGLWAQTSAAANGRAWPLFVVAALSVPRKEKGSLYALLFAAAASAVTVGVTAPDSPVKDAARYSFGFSYPFEMAACLALAAGVGRPTAVLRTLVPGVALVAVGIGIHLMSIWDDYVSWHSRFIPTIAAQLARGDGWQPNDPDASAIYRDLQSRVPPNQPLLVMVDEPYRFDYRRNPIFIYDLPGAVAPEAGRPAESVPFFQGGKPLAQYLRRMGFRFVAVIRPKSSTALYRTEEWEQHTRQHSLFSTPAKFILDAIASFDELSATKLAVFETNGLVLLDLAADPNVL